ncbi:MAG TPA: succinylglutamate desuccinylase/aspartoacylase family protein [Azospirillum sp.]
MFESTPIQLQPPDIAPYRHGNTGIDYVTTLDGGRPGPHVVVNALTHGNEICGAVAIDALFRLGVKPLRGKLTLSLANVAAYQSFDQATPYAARFIDEDFNRLWSPDVLDGGRDSLELRRARALRPVFDAADALLDVHSMTNDTPPLTLCGRTARGRALGKALGYPAWIVADEGHASGRRLIDYDGFADEGGTRTAVLVECGQHWRAETGAVAVETCLRFLLHLGMVDPALAGPRLRPRSTPQRTVEVTHVVTARGDAFHFDAPYAGLEVVPTAGTVIGHDGDVPLATPYDDCVLIMPARRVRPGQTAVRLGRIVA